MWKNNIYLTIFILLIYTVQIVYVMGFCYDFLSIADTTLNTLGAILVCAEIVITIWVMVWIGKQISKFIKKEIDKSNKQKTDDK